MSDISSPGPTPPSGSPDGRPSRRPNWTGIAIVLLSVAVVAVAALLVVDVVRDRNADDVTLTTTSDDALRAEVTAAIENYFATVDEAYATGDPSKLDGLYPEGSALGEGDQERVVQLGKQNRRIVRVTRVRTENVRFVSDFSAQAEVVVVTESGRLVDSGTGEVVQEISDAESTSAFMLMERIDGSWKVAELDFEAESRSAE